MIRALELQVVEGLSGFVDLASDIQEGFLKDRDEARLIQMRGVWLEAVEHFLSWYMGKAYIARLQKPERGDLPGPPGEPGPEARAAWSEIEGKKRALATFLAERQPQRAPG
jgi:hypothetical protein